MEFIDLSLSPSKLIASQTDLRWNNFFAYKYYSKSMTKVCSINKTTLKDDHKDLANGGEAEKMEDKRARQECPKATAFR